MILTVLLQACSGQKEAEVQKVPPIVENQELALQYFLAGSMLDQKGEYAKAVLEYQDAIKYKRDPAIYHAMSKDYSLLGKHDLAIQSAAEAVRLEENNSKYRQALAEIYLNAGNLQGGVEQFEQLVKIDSSDRTIQMNLARLYQIHNPSKSIALYETILRRFGPEPDALAQLARLYNDAGRFDSAIVALSELSDLEPSNLEIRKALADVYLRQDSVDAGLAIYKEIAAVRPDDLEIRAAIARSYLLKQDYEKAAGEFESVFTGGDSLSADDQIRFGQVFVASVQGDSAIAPYARTLFLKIRDRFPDDWRPYWFLGALSNITHNDSAALGYFSRVKELAEWNPDGWIGVASVYYDAGNFPEAIRTLNEAKNFVPEEFRVYLLLGISYQRSGQRVEAASALEKALTINSRSVDAYSALALVYDELGRNADSDSAYERGLAIDPDNHLILNNYSYSLAGRNMDLERALKMSARAVEQQPENQSYLDTYGWIYYQMGDYQRAREFVNKAIMLGSSSAVVHEHLGDIYFKLSDPERAMEYWKKALEFDPANAGLAEKIRRGSL
ncbi:MAG TPA: tetratricopeptide repeat protein [Bacteroidota bacterium]|nr:tetratricopeptide repeat protein [Bacteroidota bacterium]